jgi:hypothetical protein
MDLVEFEFAQMGKSAHRGVKKNQSVANNCLSNLRFLTCKVFSHRDYIGNTIGLEC